MAEPLGLGIIGAGAIARGMYVPVARSLGNEVKILAMADPVPGKAAEQAQPLGATAYEDFQQVLSHPGVQAVVVCTTIATHGPIALEALKAGKHVLLQKPMATSVGEADEIIAEANRQGVILQCEPPHYMNPSMARVREDLGAGLLGKLALVVSRASHSGPPDRPWFYFKENGGSVIFDMGVHALTSALAVGGPAKRVTAMYTRVVDERMINNKPLRPDIEDNAVLTLEFASGGLATIITNYCTVASHSPTLEVYGSEGTVLVNSPTAGYMRFSSGGVLERPGVNDEKLGWYIPVRIGPHQASMLGNSNADPSPITRRGSLGHFVDCIRTGAKPVPSGELARHSLEIMVKAAAASANGQTQTIDSRF